MPASWVNTKPCPSPLGLLDDEHREPPVCEGTVRIRAGQEHQHVGAGGEGAPRLDAVDEPAPLRRRGRGHDAGDVGTEVGLGHRHRGEHFGRGQLRQPLLLLRFSAAVDEGAGEDLGSRDQRPADAERTPAQLLGGDHHAQVVALASGGEPLVLLGHGEPESAQFGQAADDLLGDIAVGPVDVLGVGAHLVLGEAVERLAYELEVTPEMPRPLDVGERSQRAPGRGPRAGIRLPARSSHAAFPMPPLSLPRGR